MNDTTKADQKAELARQAAIVAAVAKAHTDELPGLGDDNGVPKDAKPAGSVRSVTTGPVLTTELAKAKV